MHRKLLIQRAESLYLFDVHPWMGPVVSDKKDEVSMQKPIRTVGKHTVEWVIWVKVAVGRTGH